MPMNMTTLRRILKIAILLMLSVVLLITAVNVGMVLATRDQIRSVKNPEFPDADCILVLGAGVRDDGSPSHMLEDRLKVGISLYESGAADLLLMSGDHGQAHYDEVSCMLQYAVNAGVPAEAIFLDHAGFSTYESLYRAREIFGAKRILIVTQEYHLYRALFVADALGLEAVGISADLRTYMGQSMRDAREGIARVKDWLFSIFQPKPTYLGDPIPLTGDALVTHD